LYVSGANINNKLTTDLISQRHSYNNKQEYLILHCVPKTSQVYSLTAVVFSARQQFMRPSLCLSHEWISEKVVKVGIIQSSPYSVQ